MRLPVRTGALEQAIGGGWAEREELRTDLVREREMPMALQGRHEFGQKGDQAFRTDTVGRSPRGFERGLDSRSIAWCPWPANSRRHRQGRLRQQLNGILAGITSRSDEFIKDDRLLRVPSSLVARGDLRE